MRIWTPRAQFAGGKVTLWRGLNRKVRDCVSILICPLENVAIPRAHCCAPHQRRGVLTAVGQRHAQEPLVHVLSGAVADTAAAVHLSPGADGDARRAAVAAHPAATVALHSNQTRPRSS